jgi:hypothetical protein
LLFLLAFFELNLHSFYGIAGNIPEAVESVFTTIALEETTSYGIVNVKIKGKNPGHHHAQRFAVLHQHIVRNRGFGDRQMGRPKSEASIL